MKRILVTGGAGFVGSHLCERLLHEGNHVICLDDFYTGNRQNIAGLIGNPAFRLEEHDVRLPFEEECIDEIYHLACPASPVHYQENAVRTLETSVLGSINVLKLAQRHNAKVLLTSTSEVYGNPLVHPQVESYWGNVNPIGIRSCYDEGKRCAETLFTDYHRQYGVRTRIVRIFNTYGPKMQCNDGRVISNFILQALQNKDITLYGDGKQTRSFQYVDDLVEGLLKLMQADDSVSYPINIGNTHEITMNQLAESVIALTGSHSKITFLDAPEDDPKRRKPDISLAKKVLNWQPLVSLEEGLKRTIDYFAGVLNNS
jgi:UDP-glucuronate decarboxylase